jgi:hypothetical protein
MAQGPGPPGVPIVAPPTATPPLPDTIDENGLIDLRWFKVVITKCPSGNN